MKNLDITYERSQMDNKNKTIQKVITAYELEKCMKEGWIFHEAFFQDDSMMGCASNTIVGTDQYGSPQWNQGEIPVVALSRRYYVMTRTVEVDRVEELAEQKKIIEEKSAEITVLMKDHKIVIEKYDDECKVSTRLKAELSDAFEDRRMATKNLERIKRALGHERFEELVNEG